MPRVTVLRKLADLRARGLIERPSRRAYTLGSLEVPGPAHSLIIAALQR
ncbi:hypothetical protein, partial [Escherichia coli]